MRRDNRWKLESESICRKNDKGVKFSEALNWTGEAPVLPRLDARAACD